MTICVECAAVVVVEPAIGREITAAEAEALKPAPGEGPDGIPVPAALAPPLLYFCAHPDSAVDPVTGRTAAAMPACADINRGACPFFLRLGVDAFVRPVKPPRSRPPESFPPAQRGGANGARA